MAPDIGQFVSDEAAYQRSVDAFRNFDVNRDGYISREELSRVFRAIDPERWDDARIEQLMDVADTNCDGLIQYEEFVAWLMQEDSSWEADKGAAQINRRTSFAKKALIMDRRDTMTTNELIVLEVDQRPGRWKLGAQVDGSDGQSLIIKELRPGGFLEKFNSECKDRQVSPGDRIIDVNGVRGNVKLMMKELSKQLVNDVTIEPRAAALRFVNELSDFYTLDRTEIALGTFSSVRKATHNETRKEFAVKSLHKRLSTVDEFKAISSMMKKFDHPNVLKLFEVFEDQLDFHFVTEFCTGGELLERILTEVFFTERQAVRIMRQIFAAVGYLHQQSICHRDVRPDHFVLAEDRPVINCVVKLIDFRCARHFDDRTVFKTQVGPYLYMAPEVARNLGYNQKADMWSCGVLMYLAISGYPPFVGETEADTLAMVRRGVLQFPDDWNSVSEDAKDLIRRLLETRTRERFSAAQAISHRWVENSEQGGIDFPLHKGQRNMKMFCGHNKLKKAALHTIAQRLPHDQIRELQDMFVLLDRNGDKMVTWYELKSGLDRLGAEETLTDLQTLMEEIDVDGSLRIDYTEFLAAALDSRRYREESACRAAFHVFDRDGSGSISKQELAQVLCSEDVKSTVRGEDITRVLQECDKDGDGSIDFHEFMKMMRDEPLLADM